MLRLPCISYFSCVVDAMSYVWGVAFGKDIGAEKNALQFKCEMGVHRIWIHKTFSC